MISIIVPVYNIENEISRCIDSILSQTYNNWELILIDDGSKDSSGYLCDSYSLNDPRIAVYHIANGGLANARNEGLKHIKGDWVTFIDGDDWISSEYLEKLIEAGIESNSDIVITGFEEVNGNQSTHYIPIPGTYDINCLGEILLNHNSRLFYNAWLKLFKVQFLKENNLCFLPELRFAEDIVFMFSVLPYIKTITFINKGEYKYIRRKGALSDTKRKYEEAYKIHQLILTIYYNQIKDKFSKEIEKFIGKTLISSMETYLKLILDSNDKNEIKKRFKNIDYNIYRKFKICNSWKEWILKKILCMKMLRLYLFLIKL